MVRCSHPVLGFSRTNSKIRLNFSILVNSYVSFLNQNGTINTLSSIINFQIQNKNEKIKIAIKLKMSLKK